MTSTRSRGQPIHAFPSSIEQSRRAIFEEIADPLHLTVVQGPGNLGDELIFSGIAALLEDFIYEEVHYSELPSRSGEVALIAGSGAWCRPYHEVMPRLLAVCELQFRRVIVLPSSYDPSEDVVRETLARSHATFFARELDSLRRIAPLCDARAAHDCAFFFDYSEWRERGSGVGTLEAFRGDRESRGHPLPVGNRDISHTADGLESWLEQIAEHELIRTDRAHVMIAAALLGKRVQFAPSSYHKLQAIARDCLSGYQVERIETEMQGEATLPAPPRPPSKRSRRPRVTALVLTRDRPQRLLAALDSVGQSEQPTEILVIDNNSAPEAAHAVARGCAERGVRLQRMDRNLGTAGGRQLGVAQIDTELVLLLDDDAELAPGALDVLVDQLDADADVQAISATVVLPDGVVQHSGGALTLNRGVAHFELVDAGRAIGNGVTPSGPAQWVPGTASLVERSLLARFPLDSRMRRYFEDNDWSFRVQCEYPQAFARSAEAIVTHHFTPLQAQGVDYGTRSAAIDLLFDCAQFYARHGLLLAPASFYFVPELVDQGGQHDLAGARVLMELLLSKGPDWTFAKWEQGELEGLLAGRRQLAEREQEIAAYESELTSAREQLAYLTMRDQTLEAVLNGRWWRLRERLLPLRRSITRAQAAMRR